jgi:hypothetical protein
VEKKFYKNLGIILLILSFILLISRLFLFGSLLIVPNALQIFFGMLSLYSLYEKIAMFSIQFFNYVIILWTIVLSIILIKNNEYNKGLLYLTYSFVILKILSFVLYLPLKKFIVIDLITGLLVYFFLIYHNNKLSRMINPKKQKK